MAFEAQDRYASYDQVPAMRKRWVFVLFVLFLIPIGLIMAVSGDIYALRQGQVVRYPKSLRMGLVVLWIALIILAIMQIAGI